MQIKTVTVIGANGAMGANISGIFASFGDAKVYMVGRDPEKIKLAREKGAKSVKADKVAENLIAADYSELSEIIPVSDLVFESVADIQKNNAKKKNPNRFCDKGLYRIVRCPNYLGEMIFWTGVLVSGVNVLSGVGQWVLALIGYIGIIFVMFSGARRLEIRQNKNYGKDPEYQAYVKKVPIMVPFIPLYSVEKYKFLVA